MLRTLCTACMLVLMSAEHSWALLTNETSCDRHRSRLVVLALEEYLVPHIRKVGYELPTSCPLHPSRNIYARQEQHKVPLRHHHWKCGFCDAVLRSEHWLDNHLDEKHPAEVDAAADACFGDHCAAVHCEHLSTWLEGHYIDGSRTGPCRERVMSDRRQQCRVRAHHALTHCPGLECGLSTVSAMPKTTDRAEYMVGSFCEAHTCQNKQRNRLLRRIRKARRKGHIGYRFLIAVAVILMVAFYFGLWIYHSQNSGYRTKSELPSKRRGQSTGWMGRLARAAQTRKLD